MSAERADLLRVMLVIGLLLAVLVIEFIEAAHPLPLCPESHCSLLPTGKPCAILEANRNGMGVPRWSSSFSGWAA